MSAQVNDLNMPWELQGLFSDVEVCPLLVELSEVSVSTEFSERMSIWNTGYFVSCCFYVLS